MYGVDNKRAVDFQMWPYWIMFLLPAFGAILEQRLRLNARSTFLFQRQYSLFIWIIFPLFSLLIGLRQEVGGDWGNYLRNFDLLRYDDLADVWIGSDPGYRLLEWISNQMGWGIYGVNLMSAVIFSMGLIWFCRHLPRPWLALAISVPYVVIVLGMGYSRQGLALACAMIGMVALSKSSNLGFVLWTLLGATFHKSAVLLLPLAGLAASRGRVFVAIWVTAVMVVAYFLLLADSVEALQQNYLEAGYQSEGTLIRLTMNLIPALIFLIKGQKFYDIFSLSKIWFYLSLLSIAFMLLYYLSPSSAAVDRLALYALPLQMVIFSGIPDVFKSRNISSSTLVVIVLVYYCFVLFTWLNFANNSMYWIPYRINLF